MVEGKIMSENDFGTAISYIYQALIIFQREGRGERYLEEGVEGLKNIAFNLEQGFEEEYYSYIYENQYCQADFV